MSRVGEKSVTVAAVIKKSYAGIEPKSMAWYPD